MNWTPRLYADRTVSFDIERGNLQSCGEYDQMVVEATFTWDADWSGIYDVQAWMPDKRRGGWRRLALSVADERKWKRHIEMKLQEGR